MIGIGEGFSVGLSLVLSLVSPLEPPNHGSELPSTLMGAPRGLRFVSEVIRYWYFCHRPMDFPKDTWGGGGGYFL